MTKDKWMTVGVVVVFVAALGFLSTMNSAAVTDDKKAAAKEEKPAEKIASTLVKDAPLKTDYVMGKDSAPVTIIEYASMSCPHCAHFTVEEFPAIKKKYIDTGKVRYILRQFPLNEPALRGAELAQCAAAKGGADKYYDFVRVLFDRQNSWAFDPSFMDNLKKIGVAGGMSEADVDKCLGDKAAEEAMMKARKQASDELKIPATPHFIINGFNYDQPHDAKTLGKHLDGLLKK